MTFNARTKNLISKHRRSFTLVELLVTIAIIGLLAAMAVVASNPARAKARDATRMQNIKQITNALELAFAFNNSYPNSGATVCLSTCMSGSPPAWCADLKVQMPNIPNDPLPSQQCYLYNSDGSNFRVAARFESSSNSFLAQNDGGLYAEFFEGQSTPGQIQLGWAKYASAAGGNWSSDSGTWVTTSGGSTVTTHPIAGDTAILDANSGNVTVDTASACNDITATGYTHTLTLSAGLTVYGNLLFVAGMTFTPGTQTVTFAATTTGNTITTGGKSFYNVTCNGSGGAWTLQDNMSVTGALTVSKGTLAVSTYNLAVTGNSTVTGSGGTATVTIGASSSTGWTTTDLTIGASGVVTCSGNSLLNIAGSSDISAGTFTYSTSTVTFTATSSGKTLKSGGKIYYKVTFNGSGGSWTLLDNFKSLTNTFDGDAHAVEFIVGTLNFNGFYFSASRVDYLQRMTITVGNGFTLNIGTGRLSVGNGGSDYGTVSIVVSDGGTITMANNGVLAFAHLFEVSGSGTAIFTGTPIVVARNIYINTTNASCSLGQSFIRQHGGHSTIYTNKPLYNWELSGNAIGGVAIQNVWVTLQSDVVVLNNLKLDRNGSATAIRSLDAVGYTITVGGGWNIDTEAADSGFICGTSTVEFNDASKVSTITGRKNTTFYNLKCVTPSKTIKFKAGSNTGVTSLELVGASGQLISIDTDTGASTFNLSDSSGTNQIYYTSVTRSAAGGGATWNALLTDGNVNGGSNSGWTF